ncbi:AAA family ATPase [Corynebacterium variabile]|uniref:AAA family ATPase n=1 Tax=Corynebacterium variabile TaxID=1727 RepID=UPI0028A73596|nr:ATP-binding protein [Corynebacterium variabile]
MTVDRVPAPRVVMMCGPGGAGKTTYAKGLEADGWTRLSFEVEFWNRGVTTLPSAEVVAEVSAELKARLLRLIAAGEDVVLDFGFWFRRQRDEYRALLAPQGIVPVTVYIATSLSTILSRIDRRHGSQADDWPLTEQTATECFEPPSPEEGPLDVIADSDGSI